MLMSALGHPHCVYGSVFDTETLIWLIVQRLTVACQTLWMFLLVVSQHFGTITYVNWHLLPTVAQAVLADHMCLLDVLVFPYPNTMPKAFCEWRTSNASGVSSLRDFFCDNIQVLTLA